MIRLQFATYAKTEYDDKFLKNKIIKKSNNQSFKTAVEHYEYLHIPILNLLSYTIAILKSVTEEKNPEITKLYIQFLVKVLERFHTLKTFENYEVPQVKLTRLKLEAVYQIHRILTLYQIKEQVRKQLELFHRTISGYISDMDKELILFNDICYESFNTHKNKVNKRKFLSYQYVKFLFLFKDTGSKEKLNENIIKYFSQGAEKENQNLFFQLSHHKFPKELQQSILKDVQYPINTYNELTTKFKFKKEERKTLTKQEQKEFNKTLNMIRLELLSSFQKDPFRHIAIYRTHLRSKEESHIPSKSFIQSLIQVIIKGKIITYNKKYLENLFKPSILLQPTLFYKKLETILLQYLELLRSHYNAVLQIKKEYNSISQGGRLSVEQATIVNYLFDMIIDKINIRLDKKELNYYKSIHTKLGFDDAFSYQLPHARNLIKLTKKDNLSKLAIDTNTFKEYIASVIQKTNLVLEELDQVLDYYKIEYEGYTEYYQGYAQQLTLHYLIEYREKFFESVKDNLAQLEKVFTTYTTEHKLLPRKDHITQRDAA